MALAWPAIFENIMTTLIQFVNTAMVSHLGPVETAAVGINMSPIWMINGIITAVGVGATALVARFIGASDYEKANKVARQSLILGAVLGVIVTCLLLLYGQIIPKWMGADNNVLPLASTYLKVLSTTFVLYFTSFVMSGVLRGAGDTRTPMRVNILMNIINIICNFFLIYPARKFVLCFHTDLPVISNLTFPEMHFQIWGAGLGTTGAAISTAISQGLAGIILLYILFRGRLVIGLNLKESYWPDFSIIKKILFVGVPAAAERIIISSGQMFFAKLIAGLGTIQLAAHYLANTAESISYMPAFGLSIAATALVGQKLGAGDVKKAEEYGYGTFKIGLFAMTFMSMVFLIFPHYLISLFTGDSLVISYGASVLQIEAFAQPFFASSIILAGALRGAGDTRWPLYVAMLSMWGIRLTLAWTMIEVFSLGLKGAWISMVIDLAIRGILIFIRYRNGNWKNININ